MARVSRYHFHERHEMHPLILSLFEQRLDRLSAALAANRLHQLCPAQAQLFLASMYEDYNNLR
ncbi:hypothetical protein TIFTF001_009957 [Ficus carica]|uniref:Uncharacterized protein n=1 Tax=Ficus carica TaxID=3494 RepID=A0AA87ZW72_FICCA|nr:hypothetical protein TIFTF001_009957 [Ficus carica]